MFKGIKKSIGFLILSVFVLSSQFCWAAEKTIYFDDFSGTGPLNGTAPDIRPGQETWIASSVYSADGTVGPESPDGYTFQALLPFSPEEGQVYTLSLDVDPRNSPDVSTWFALGFTSSGAAESSEGDDQFYSSGIGWILHRITRNSPDDDEIQTFLGPGEEGVQSHPSKEEGFVKLSIVLDTTSSQWIVEWFRNDQSIRGPEEFTTNPQISYVGFTKFWVTGGAVDNFSLTIPNPPGASDPNPADEQTDVPAKLNLQWAPGIYAVLHDIYLGTNFDDVNDATAADDPAGVYLGRYDTNYYPDGGTLRLEYEQNYYWRVDEVNGPPDQAVFKGRVWNFTVEPLAYPIPGENITATASSYLEDQGPEKTIDSSGLNDDNLHSNVLTDMWLSEPGEPGSAWIQYEFDRAYKLNEMLVWNYNGQAFLTSLGLMDISIEYSAEGAEWIQLDGVTEFARATGAGDYAYNTIVPFSDLTVKKVKIIANNNWAGGGLFNLYGLSEVRFMYIPVSASDPEPGDGATDIPLNTILRWKTGREAAEHKVYLSTERQAVIDGTAPVISVDQAGHGPLSLDLEQTYYWRIDEVNDAETPVTWQGETWSFSTQEYLVVDDFESYNDIPEDQQGSNLVYNTWEDGYNDPTNGSTIGYVMGSSLETDNIHGGAQSVPLMYENTTANLSEVTVNTADLPIGQDWSIGSSKMLIMWFHGDPGNSLTDRMYVKLNDTKLLYEGDITRPIWQQWNIDLTDSGVDTGNITSMSIGFEKTGATGGSGTVFLDDIRLYHTAPTSSSEEIWLEAESADTVTGPMAIYDDPAASGGRYIGTTDEIGNSSSEPPAPVRTYTLEIGYREDGGLLDAILISKVD